MEREALRGRQVLAVVEGQIRLVHKEFDLFGRVVRVSGEALSVFLTPFFLALSSVEREGHLCVH